MTDFQWDDRAMVEMINSDPVIKHVVKVGVQVETEARRSLHQGGTGRIYARSNPKRLHRASAPGQAPATDLGTLAASLRHIVGRDSKGAYVDVGSPLRKALLLELGTRTIRPRPFLRLAVRKVFSRSR